MLEEKRNRPKGGEWVAALKRVFQDPFRKFESINNLSGRKPFHFFWPVHPLPLNSAQSSSLLVFSLSLKFVLLPWLYWVGLPPQRNIVPSHAAQTLNKRRVTVSEMLSKLGGGKKPHITEYEVTPVKTKPPLYSSVPLPVNMRCTASFLWGELKIFCLFKNGLFEP